MKKAVLFLAAAVLLSTGAHAAADAPSESAAACILVEADSGRTLYEKNADSPMLIASTTKIVTALTVLESCALDEGVEIRPEWTGIEGSSMYLAAGERYTVRELLGGLMLASGNDAAVALACHAAGSIGAFAVKMNELAQSIGCENTHFTNPSGLDDEEHYSCARDLARIARRAIENEELRAIASSRSMTIHGNTYYNHNKLLEMCEGAFGLKTGYTMAAGRTLVSCCERDGMTLICVTLCDRSDWDDHMALYDWGFETWQRRSVAPAERSVPLVGGTAETLPVRAAGSVTLPLCETDELRFSYELPRFVFAGVKAGETLGRAVLYDNGEYAAELPLRSAADTAAAGAAEESSLLRFLKTLGRNIYTF